MIATILQVTGAILLAKGLIFRKEFDVFLYIFSFGYIINSKRNGRIEIFYQENYVSIIGASWLILGYAFPLVGWELNFENGLIRLLIAVISTAFLIFISIITSNFCGEKKAKKVSEEELLKKYSNKAREMGFSVIGIDENDD